MSTILEASQDTVVLLGLHSPETRGRSQLAEGLGQNGYLAAKAVLEFCMAALLLAVTAPVILLCALLVKLTSRGPAFYSQTRLGLGGRPYRIYKLRTMYHQCELRSGPQWSQKGDLRVTPLGRLLRSTHLDELPQLWNVLRGEMGLIGPRPERPEFIPSLVKAVPLYQLRMLVRPGVTGLAQVQLPADTDLNSVRAKVAHDLYYIRNAGVGMDLRILLATALKVFGGSFTLLRACFSMPAHAQVERDYQRLLHQAAAAPGHGALGPALPS